MTDHIVQSKSAIAFYEKVLDRRSKVAIDYLIEDALKDECFDVIEDTPKNESFVKEKERLMKMYETNNLDLCWAYANEALGRISEAETLRAWAANKNKKQRGI